MTPQFTTACYVRVDNTGHRAKIRLELKRAGYDVAKEYPKYHRPYVWAYYYVLYFLSASDAENLRESIDCGTNIDLFVALAGMRSDTDKGQWFICINHCLGNNKGDVEKCIVNKLENPNYRKCTAKEIIQHFKKKDK